MIRFEAATVMLQWATGGFAFLWVTTRGRLVGLGYGWLMRSVFAVIGILGLALALRSDFVVQRDMPAIAMVLAALLSLAVSVVRKGAGVYQQRVAVQRKTDRVAAMVAASHPANSVDGEVASASMQMRDQFGRLEADDDSSYTDGPEFPPVLDLVAPVAGMIGVIGAAFNEVVDTANAAPLWLVLARFVVGALFLGAVSDAMLLGHWYLVQPGLPRRPIHELNDWLLRLWPIEVALLLTPTGMLQALSGEVKDGWRGMLTWFWFACALSTGILAGVTKLALRERFYSAVMAATGFLYLAILMAFCTDLVARAILNP
jgi:hypothetical protein